MAGVTADPSRIPNVLAARYASPELTRIWSPETKVVLERRLWLAVLYEKPRSAVRCEYVWRRTDRWIDFPWSSTPPVTGGAGEG